MGCAEYDAVSCIVSVTAFFGGSHMKIANSILICVLLLFAVQNVIASESAHHETNETVKDETNLMEQPVSFAVLPNA